MEVSGYCMDLYCDNESVKHPSREFPHTFTGETNLECKRQAKRNGWTFIKGRVFCPKCNKK